MARLMNTKLQPIRFYYIGKRGREKIMVPPKGTVEVPDLISPISKSEIEKGWIVIMSDLAIKMQDAEIDAKSYMETISEK